MHEKKLVIILLFMVIAYILMIFVRVDEARIMGTLRTSWLKLSEKSASTKRKKCSQ